MPKRLNQKEIQSAIEEARAGKTRVERCDPELPGLRLRISPRKDDPDGKRTSPDKCIWALACRDKLGRMRRFPLGEYPKLGIKQARDAARALRVEVRNGADPVEERRRQRAIGRDAREGIGTMRALLDIYAGQDGAELKSWPECRRRIESVFAPFLKKPLATIKTADLQVKADGWKSKQSAAAAVRYLRPVLKWASKRGYVGIELAGLHPPATVRRRDRVLSPDELAALLPVLEASARPYASALHLMLLTLARREEVCAARWRDVDLQTGVWTIPETKGGRAHKLPLSRQAAALLGNLHSSTATPNVLVSHTASGGRLGNWDRETKKLMQVSNTREWTRHDLRRTGATLLGELGTDPHVIEAALNHTALHSPLASVYNRARYFPAVQRALQQLADHLDGIVGNREPVNAPVAITPTALVA